MGRLRRAAWFLIPVALSAVLVSLSLSAGQSQSAEKKKEQKKTRKVWTNDDIPLLQQSRGVSVVGTPPPSPVQPAGEAKAPPPAETQPENPYLAMSLEKRQEFIAQLEQEIADGEVALRDLRNQLDAAQTEEEWDKLREQVGRLEQAMEENRAEIEIIRNTPPPPPPKPGEKATKPEVAPPAPAPAQTPPSTLLPSAG